MSRISFNRFALENQNTKKTKLQKDDVKTIEQSLNVKNVYTDGKLSQQIGLSFQGNFLTNFNAIKDFNGQLIPKNDLRYSILKDINDGKYLEYGIGKKDIPEITRFLEVDKVEELKIILDNNKRYETNSLRFELKDIEEILNSIDSNNRKHFKTLVESKDNKNSTYRILTDELSSVLRSINKHNTFFVEKVINKQSPPNNEKIFNSSEIAYALQSINDFTANHFDEVLNLKSSNDKQKFDKEDIIDILNALKPDNIDHFYKLAKIDSFSGSEIGACLEYLNKDSDNVVDYVIQNNESPALTRNLTRVFECVNNDNLKQLKTLHNAFKNENLTEISFNCFLRLIQTDTIDQLEDFKGLLKSKRVAFHELNKILNGTLNYIGEQSAVLKPDNAKYLLPLLQAKTEDNNNYRFEVQDINSIIKCTNRNNHKILDYLLNERNSDNNNFKFSGFYLRQILPNSSDSNLEELKKLCNLRNPENTGFLYSNDEIRDFSYLVNADLPAIKILEGCTINDLSEIEQRNLLKFYRNKGHFTPQAFLKNEHLPSIKTNPEDIDELKKQVINKLTNATWSRIQNESVIIDNKKLNQTIESLQQSIKYSEINNNNNLKLNYSRKNLVGKTNNILKSLNDSDKKLALDFYGCNIQNNKLKGFPYIRKNNIEKLKELKYKSNDPYKLEIAIKQLEKLFNNFISNNKISLTGNKELEKDLNDFVKSFPEWLTTINKEQHDFHKYTLDIHILRTLKNFVEDQNFQKLSHEDKKIAVMFIMLHDITKAEGDKDFNHPEDSAKAAYQILKRTDLSDRNIERITGLIRNHEWVGHLENSNYKEDVTKNYAFEFRKAGDFDIAKIFAKADLEASGNTRFYEKNKDNYLKYSGQIEELIKSFNETGIYVPQTKIPKASQINCNNGAAKEININGESKNTIVYLKNTNDFESLGFEKGTNKDNLRMIAHFIKDDNRNITRDIDYASLEGNNGVFSASYINPKNNVSFFNCKSGFIFDVEPENIGLAHCNNIGSGREKNLDTFKSYIMDKGIRENYARNYFSDKAKNIMKKNNNLSSIDYGDIFKHLSNKKSITEIKKPEIINLIEETINNTLLSNIHHNELVVYAPKPKALISKETPEKIPLHLRKYAEIHDLPIIII